MAALTLPIRPICLPYGIIRQPLPCRYAACGSLWAGFTLPYALQTALQAALWHQKAAFTLPICPASCPVGSERQPVACRSALPCGNLPCRPDRSVPYGRFDNTKPAVCCRSALPCCSIIRHGTRICRSLPYAADNQ